MTTTGTVSAASPPQPWVEDRRTYADRTFQGRLRRGMLRTPAGLLGLLLVLTMVLLAVAGPAIAPQDPLRQNVVRRLQGPVWQSGDPASLLGTDQLGRDVLSRTLVGARVSLTISLIVVALATMLGAALGLLVGLRGGWLDVVVMRVADSLLALPFLVVALAVIAVWGGGQTQIIVLLIAFGWVPTARVVRADVLSAARQEYVEAARCLGADGLRVAVRHILPNVLSPVIVLATFSVGAMMIAESALSFLGLGVPPPTPSWGSMLNDGRRYLDTAWWIGLAPGMAITLTVVGVNFLGDALRDMLDPRQRL